MLVLGRYLAQSTATCNMIEGVAKKACDEGDQDGCKWLDTIKNRK